MNTIISASSVTCDGVTPHRNLTFRSTTVFNTIVFRICRRRVDILHVWIALVVIFLHVVVLSTYLMSWCTQWFMFFDGRDSLISHFYRATLR